MIEETTHLCKAEEIIKLLGKKWSLQILREITTKRSIRFSELKKQLKISQKILSERLLSLEGARLLKKSSTGEYTCTPLGSQVDKLIVKIEETQS